MLQKWTVWERPATLADFRPPEWRYRLRPLDRPAARQWTEAECLHRLGALLELLSGTEHPTHRQVIAGALATYRSDLKEEEKEFPLSLNHGVPSQIRRAYDAAMVLSGSKLSGMGGLDDYGLPIETREIMAIVSQTLALGTRYSAITQ